MAEAIHGSDSYFERITDNLPVMIWRTDKEGNCIYLNKLWCEFTGRSLEDSIKKGWQASVHPRDVSKVSKIFSTAVAEKKSFELSYYLKDKNGDFFFVTANGKPEYDINGGFEGYLGTIINLDDKRKVEVALEESEQRHLLAVECAGMGVWEYDIASGNVYCSERVMEIFGLEGALVHLDTLVGQMVSEHRQMVREKIEDAITEKSENYEVDFSVVNVKDGSIRSIVSKGKLFKDINGRPAKLVGTCLDITSERSVSEQLRVSAEKYRHLFESSPVSLCEENLSFFREVAFRLAESGVKDFHSYFQEHPEEYLTLVRNIQVNALNAAIVKLVEAGSKEEVINGLEKIFVGPTQNDIIDQLVFILRGGGIMNSKPPCGP